MAGIDAGPLVAVRRDAARGGDPGAIPAVRTGRAGVQDEGSQLVALALAAAPVDGRDERWLDLCAGPGGKAALLAGLAGERGAVLVARERRRTGPAWSRAALRGLRAARDRGRGDGIAAAVAAGDVRPGARRRSRAPASVRCGAVRRRAGVVAGRRRRPRRRCSAAARRGAGRGPARRRRRLRHLLAAPGGDPRCGRRGPARAADDVVERGRADRSCRLSPTWATGPARPALAAPARHRRDVPRRCCAGRDLRRGLCRLRDRWASRSHPASCPPTSPTSQAAARSVAGGRLAARRRDGQPLRPEPDARPAGGRVAGEGGRRSRSTAT